MVGTSSDVIFADAALKEVTGFDLVEAFDASLRHATTLATVPAVGRKGLRWSTFLGWTPTDIPEGTVPAGELVEGTMPVLKFLVRLGLAKSNNDARRLVQQGGVTVGPDRERVTDPMGTIAVTDGLTVRVGSKRIVRVRVVSSD